MVWAGLCQALCNWAISLPCPGHCIHSELWSTCSLVYYGLCLHLLIDFLSKWHLKCFAEYTNLLWNQLCCIYSLYSATCVSPVLFVTWNTLFIQAYMAGYPSRTAVWSWVCFLVNKHWFLSGLVGEIYFNPLVNSAIRDSSVERSPTSGSEAACCMKGAWWVKRNPVTPLEMQMQLLLLFCRREPCWASQKGRGGVQASFTPPGKCKHKLWSDVDWC